MHPIMDETGKAEAWVKAGRGVRVWESQDIGAGRPDMLTPGDVDTPPHWAYSLAASKVIDAPVFFRRWRVVKSWTDTPAGWKAAERYLGAMSIGEKNAERDAPIGKVYTRYSIERYSMRSDETVRMDPPGQEPYDRPLDVEFRVGVMEWSAIVRKES